MAKRINIPQDIVTQICKEHLYGTNVHQLALKFLYPRRAIERVLAEHNLLKSRSEINRSLHPELADYSIMHNMYVDQCMTIDQIAVNIGVSSQLIKNALKELGIQTRSRRDATIITAIRTNPNIANLKETISLYQQGASLNALCSKFNVSDTALRKYLISNGLILRNHQQQIDITDRKFNETNAKIARNLRSRLSIALKNKSKRGSAVADLGCTIDEFKSYLESKFYVSDDGRNMTWDAYGKDGWELDHVKPLSSFDLVNPDQFKDACHYTNLAPVWREHNRAKSNMPVGRKPNRVPLIVLTGQTGASTSWVASQLDQLYQYVSHDKIPKEQHYHYLLEYSFNGKPILYDPSKNSVSIYQRYGSLFDVKLVVIHEDVDTVNSRIVKRGAKAVKRHQSTISKANFSGTSVEVLAYLKNLANAHQTPIKPPKPIVYLVAGVSGAGKSWVCKQLIDKFTYVSYDANPKSKHAELLKQPSDKPKLYDPPIKISTFIKRHSNEFDIRSIFIIEDEEVIKARLEQRGGKFTESAKKRMVAILNRSKKYGIFSGTSDEVLKYLQGVN
jgi:hypothetical protein